MGSPVRLSLIRRHALLGGDRFVMGTTIALAVTLGWVVTNGYGVWYGVPLGAVIWFAGGWAARELYKSDPYAFDIWVKQLKYRRYYPPKAHHAAEVPQVKDFI